ncbi:hypothetical protein TRIUR3_21730 [Triticum urartu]|uniref:Uncharacterized protein n=1 Tax=Triticum urartu TaxID=4572 RepID=M7Z159_TRIUA|nr:hypothetical protein TRIUR3_21730 [Triticum urartu]
MSRPDAPAVEEVVWPDVVDFVAGDGALEFGTGVRDMDIVGPFELVVSDGADGGLAELQLPSNDTKKSAPSGTRCVLVAHRGVCLSTIIWPKVDRLATGSSFVGQPI